MNSLQIVKNDNLLDIYENLVERYYDIPFEHSKFQVEHFIVGGNITPERTYRALGLSIISKIRNIYTAQIANKKREIKIEQLKDKIENDSSLTKFDKDLLRLDLMELTQFESFDEKLMRDQYVELNILYSHLLKMPKLTSEQFESAERRYFEQRLQRQVFGLDGAKESIINMNEDYSAILEYQKQISLLPSEPTDEQLEFIASSLKNILKPVLEESKQGELK